MINHREESEHLHIQMDKEISFFKKLSIFLTS